MTIPYWPDRPYLLASYAYVKGWGKDMALFRDVNLLVDSGAFTADSLGSAIDLGQYCDWLLGNRHHIKHAAVLDVIGDWKATARNLDKMHARLGSHVHVLPAWHIGSPPSELDRLCREHDYVAVGGAVPYRSRPKVLMANLVRAHQIAREHGTRLHGLGITGPETFQRLPWYTTDSSTWGQGYRYGKVELVRANGTRSYMRMGRPVTKAQSALIRAYGGDPARFSSPAFCSSKKSSRDQYTRDLEWLSSAMARSSWVLASAVRQKHGSELNVYLADSAPNNLAAAKIGWAQGHPFS